MPSHGITVGGGTPPPAATPTVTVADPPEVTCTTLTGGTDTVTATITAPAGPVTVTWTVGDTVLPPVTVPVPNSGNGTGTVTVPLTQTFPVGTTVVTVSVTSGTNPPVVSAPVPVTVDSPQSTAGGKVTGGGEIALSGGKVTFGLVAMTKKDGSVHGNVEFQDHIGGHTVKSTQLTALVVSGTHAQIWGRATVDGQGDFGFVVDVDDLGEPGAGVDGFGIGVGSGYQLLETTLTGGNIQLH